MMSNLSSKSRSNGCASDQYEFELRRLFPPRPVCRVNNCIGVIVRSGMCEPCSDEWSKGAKLFKSDMTEHKIWLLTALQSGAEECTLWPYSSIDAKVSKLEPTFKFGGVRDRVAVKSAMMSLKTSTPFRNGRQVKRTCEDKTRMCCNPKHLEWRTSDG